MDKAGKSYWDAVWANVPRPEFRPGSGALRDYRDKMLAQLLARALAPFPRDALVLEAGCADSLMLPYLASLGYRIAGIDYSAIGCEKLRKRLAGIPATVVCANIFDPPSMKGDLVMSYGLVEHFDDTAACVRALSGLIAPSGRILTIIPNMRGTTGLLQRLCAPSVYAVHVPVSLKRLKAAHEAAGLKVLECAYLLPAGFGVVNVYIAGGSRAGLLLRRAIKGALARLSMLAWAVDALLPRSELFSPYVYCLAEHSP